MNALNRNAFSDRTLRAFSLTELLVVLVIIGILVLVTMLLCKPPTKHV